LDKIKKALSGMTAIAIMLSGIFVLAGCVPSWPYTRHYYLYAKSECGAWVYRYFEERDRVALEERGIYISKNGVALVSVLNVVAVVNENGLLEIPTEINGYMVVQLGDIPRRYVESRLFYDGKTRINRIVIPEGIMVQPTFWSNLYLTDYLEFLTKKPNLGGGGGGFPAERMTLIVPDGSREKYWRNFFGYHTAIYEKSEID